MADEKVTYNLCQGWGCHEHCLVETHVKDGKIDRVQKCTFPGKRPANEICMKGILSAKIPYAKDRILHPLKRPAKRHRQTRRRAARQGLPHLRDTRMGGHAQGRLLRREQHLDAGKWGAS